MEIFLKGFLCLSFVTIPNLEDSKSAKYCRQISFLFCLLFNTTQLLIILTICCLNPEEENIPFSSVQWSSIPLAQDKGKLAMLIFSLLLLGLLLLLVDIPLDIFGCACIQNRPNQTALKGNTYCQARVQSSSPKFKSKGTKSKGAAYPF